MAVSSERLVKFPQLTPLSYGSARVIYDAGDPQHSEGKSHELFHPLEEVRNRFKSKTRVDLTEIPSQFAAPRKSPHNALFRLNLDTPRTKGRGRSTVDSTTHRLQGRGRTLSCEHLSKAVETVRSVRIPNISVPCAQVVRNIVKSARTPGSASSAKEKEPYFEIVTPAAFDLTFEKANRDVSDDEDSDITSGNVSLEVLVEELPSGGESPNLPPDLHTSKPDTLRFEYSERLPNPHSAPTTPTSPTAGCFQDHPSSGVPTSPLHPVPKLEDSSVPTTTESSPPKRVPLPKPPSPCEKPAREPLAVADPPSKKVARPLPTPPTIVPRPHKSSCTTPKALPLAPTVDINRGLPPLPSR